MSNSQIQQGTTKSTQSQKIGVKGENILTNFLEQLKSVLDKLNFEEEKIKNLEREISNTQELLKNNKELVPVVKKLNSIKTILEGAAGSLLASGIASKIPEIIAALHIH